MLRLEHAQMKRGTMFKPLLGAEEPENPLDFCLDARELLACPLKDSFPGESDDRGRLGRPSITTSDSR